MLTAKGWWLLVLVLALFALGLWTDTGPLALVSLSVLLWFLAAWLNFIVRLRIGLPRLRVERELLDERGPVDSLWAGRSFRVRVALVNDSRVPTPYFWLRDRLPFGAQLVEGTTHGEGSIAGRGQRELTYRVLCPKPSRLRFEGLAVHFTDLQGFFVHVGFVADRREVRVLPALADARGHIPTMKRHNLLPLQGAHRHRRPGSGSELLDLRDYLPGDPPKMIAWKPSARRDRLMTKEFESEVPIRCTFFVDTSASVRVGAPGSNALARLVEIVASASQAAAAARDLPGLVLFDEERVSYLPPRRGKRQIIDLFHHLADAAGLLPVGRRADLNQLLPMGRGLAEEVYPQLLSADVNAVPFWLPWLWRVPGERRERGTLGRWIYRAFVGLLMAVPVAGLAYFYFFIGSLLFEILTDLLGQVPAAVGTAAIALAVVTATWHRLVAVYHALPLLFSPSERRRARWRKQLAAILSMRYDLGPGGLALLLEDDEAAAHYIQRFLAEHHVPFEPPLYDEDGRYQFAAPEKVPVLEKALLRAIGRGHDNELFVVLADFLETPDDLGPALGAVKAAVARHHQVLVVCPWPAGEPLPRREQAVEPPLPAGASPLALVKRATTARLNRAYHHLRRTFARLSVPVLCARDEDAVRLILDRLERLRSMERGVR